MIIFQPFKQKNLRLSLNFFTKNCKTIGSNLLPYLEKNGTEIAGIEPYFLQHLICFTVIVLAVPVDGVQAYTIISNLYIRTSSCKFVKMKSSLMLFLGKEKKKKTKKTLKNSCIFQFPQCRC